MKTFNYLMAKCGTWEKDILILICVYLCYQFSLHIMKYYY